MPVYTTYNCKRCGTLCRKRPSATTFCGDVCQKLFRGEEIIRLWLNNNLPMEKTYTGVNNQLSGPIRRYLIEKADNKCVRCGWGEVNLKTGKVPVQVNHIDGDSTNNHLNNLEVICPNCHSLTETFGKHGKGRKKRYAGVTQR